MRYTLPTGCPISKVPLCFGCFLGFPCLYRGSFYHFSTAQETRIPKFTLLSSLRQKFIKLQSKTQSNLDLDTIQINLVCNKIIISKSSLPHILLCNLINFLRREESKVSFGIIVSWAVEKWKNEPLYEHGKPRKQPKQSEYSIVGYPVYI